MFAAGSGVDSGAERWCRALSVIALVAFVALALQVAARVKFPWDTFIWSESPFLTNMLSLNAGRSVYGPPSDANSFVYSPGLEYLCYAILHPFGLDLDIRFCRGVVLAAGLTAAFAAARSGASLLAEIGTAPRAVRGFVPFGVMFTALVLGKNFTADVCHPDNLMVAQVTVTFALCLGAAARADLKLAVAAVAFGGLGVLAKQTAACTGAAAFVGLLLVQKDFRTARRASLLGSVALGTTAAAIAPLVARSDARFWTLTLLRTHPLDWEKLNFYDWGVVSFSHRMLLYTLAFVAWAWTARRPEAEARRFATLWLVFVLGACPTMTAYLKTFGSWNNLVLFDVLTTLLVAPVLWALMTANATDAASAPSREVFAVGAGLLVTILLTVIPTRAWPSEANYATGRELDAELTRAHKAHERVLVAHGAAALIHAGYRDVPLDRANSLVELAAGKELGRVFTAKRIYERAYDRIYINVDGWYGSFLPIIALGYDEAGVIRAPSARPEANGTERLGERFGFQQIPPFMDQEVRMYRRRAK